MLGTLLVSLDGLTLGEGSLGPLLDKRSLTNDTLDDTLDFAVGVSASTAAGRSRLARARIGLRGGRSARGVCRSGWVRRGISDDRADDRRTREDIVVSGVVDVRIEDTWVRISITTGERDDLITRGEGSGRTRRAGQADLEARRVKLCTTLGHSQLHRDELVTDEVFACWQVGWERDARGGVGTGVELGHGPSAIGFFCPVRQF
jgi:hypothetical protein